MSEGQTSEPPPAESAKADPAGLALRGRPRPVVRFRRGLIAGLAAAFSISLASLAWLALDPPAWHPTAAEPIDEQSPATMPGRALEHAPLSYEDAPQLGPPLPGDLGRPILDRRQDEATVPIASGAAGGAAERPAAIAGGRADDYRRARSSPLIVAPAGLPAAPAPAGTASSSVQPVFAESVPGSSSGQQRKIDFARSAGGPAALTEPSSPWTLSAGTIIPAALLTGLNSDLPGTVIAQVTRDVFDSATGDTILVPRGSRLVGSYDSEVSYGQRRALMVWQRLILPDGSSVLLDHMPATDSAGYSGLSDKVESHGWQLLKGAVLSSLLGIGTELGAGGGGSEIARAIRQSAQQNVSHAGDQMVSRGLDVQPTIVVRPGWPVDAIVHQDLVLRPWKG